MNQGTFRKMVSDITATFARKAPSMESLDRWWVKVMAVPDEAVPWITEQLEERDDLPKNLPNAVNALWSRWREANPNRCARDEAPRGCSRCTNGRIWYLRQDESGRWTPCVATCAHCMAKSNGNTIPWLRISDIERHGGEWIEEGRALAECAKRNGVTGNARGGGCDMVGTLQAWKGGQAPYERCPNPDDDRSDLAEGW